MIITYHVSIFMLIDCIFYVGHTVQSELMVSPDFLFYVDKSVFLTASNHYFSKMPAKFIELQVIAHFRIWESTNTQINVVRGFYNKSHQYLQIFTLQTKIWFL